MSDGRRILTDDDAESADPNLPAFLARPADKPVYHGFPLIEETRTAADSGDAFVVAPARCK